MESEVALAAIEAREEQPATALTEDDREEGFAYELVLDVRPQRELVQQPHIDLLHVERANVRVPRYDMSAAMRRRAHLAHERLQLAQRKRLHQCIAQPSPSHHLDGGALLVGQMGAQQHLWLAGQGAALAARPGLARCLLVSVPGQLALLLEDLRLVLIVWLIRAIRT